MWRLQIISVFQQNIEQSAAIQKILSQQKWIRAMTLEEPPGLEQMYPEDLWRTIINLTGISQSYFNQNSNIVRQYRSLLSVNKPPPGKEECQWSVFILIHGKVHINQLSGWRPIRSCTRRSQSLPEQGSWWRSTFYVLKTYFPDPWRTYINHWMNGWIKQFIRMFHMVTWIVESIIMELLQDQS